VADQWGVLSRRQAIHAGFSEAAIDRRLRRGRWRVLHPGVYLTVDVPATWSQLLVAAQLWGGEGARISHRSAAILWGLSDASTEIVEITTRKRTKRAGIVSHYSTAPAGVLRKGPLFVTTPTTTVIDLASVLDREALEAALYVALRQRLTALPVLRNRIESLGKGCRGVVNLRRVVEEAEGLRGIPESNLEVKFLEFLRYFHLPLPESQYEVFDPEGIFVGRVDFAYPEFKVAIEVDGYRFHSDRHDWVRDRRRLSDLVVAGWRILHVTHADVEQKSVVAATRISELICGRQLSFRNDRR
ncbi:MAG: hypothetical protein QOF16_221, partial [Actinomycetota bacterium]|nr:hypothetical protein [Actinomycetota bacterium]